MKRSKSQNLLWQHLDKLDIEFRSPKAYLIGKFGSEPCGWTDNVDLCVLQSERPFLDGLARPLSFIFDPKWDQSAPPHLLNAYNRSSDDAAANFRLSTEKLDAIFGMGIDNSASNTVSRVWSFTKGSVVATIFLPQLNPGPNSRHEKIAGSATECSIQIVTGYSCPISYRVLNALKQSPVFWRIPEDALPYRFKQMGRGTELSVPQAQGPAIGVLKIGTDPDLLFFSTTSETVDVLNLDWVVSVRYTTINPARGAGGIVLAIPYRPQGRRDVPEKHLNIVDAPYAEGAYHDLAIALADALSVQLFHYEQDDI